MSSDTSIVFVTYNRADSLDGTLHDLAGQSHRVLEILVCDDASTDRTPDICAAWAQRDSRFRYVRRQRNQGMPENLNNGLREARGEYVAILHDGNRYDEQLIERWREGLRSEPRAAFAFSAIAVVDSQGALLDTYREPLKGVVAGRSLLRERFLGSWRFASPVFGTAMVRRSVVEEAGYLNPRYGFYADVDLWMTLLHHWDAFYVADPLVRIQPRDVQPHLFSYDPWALAEMMHEMFWSHRVREFADKRWAARLVEMFRHSIFCQLDDAHRLATFARRGREGQLRAGRQHLTAEAPLLLPLWAVAMAGHRVRAWRT
jgi:glycosyltransferase involved in cell wall biosynthesis